MLNVPAAAFKMGIEAKKSVFELANNKGADQPAHPRSLISAYIGNHMNRILSKLATYLVSVSEDTALSLALSETLKTGFVAWRPNLISSDGLEKYFTFENSPQNQDQSNCFWSNSIKPCAKRLSGLKIVQVEYTLAACEPITHTKAIVYISYLLRSLDQFLL